MATSSPEKFYWKRDPEHNEKVEEAVESQLDSNKSSSDSQSSVTVLTLPAEDTPTTQKNKVVIGIPVHNAESWIARAIVEASSFGEVVICDDGSTDLTEEIARRMKCKMIKHPNELGMSDSITSLFLGARRIGADILFTLGAEASFSHSDISRLLAAVQVGDCDIAVGSRILEQPMKAESGTTKDMSSLTRAYGRRAVALIAPAGTRSVVLERDILAFAQQEGLKIKEYPLRTSEEIEQSEKQNLSAKISHRIMRTVDFATLEQPLSVFGFAAIALFIETAALAVYSFELWGITGQKPDLAFVYSGISLIVAIILGIAGSLLYSQKVTREKYEKTIFKKKFRS
ncbi:MAG: glycosyltransferase family 2 protein [Nitrososphaerales archaeon]